MKKGDTILNSATGKTERIGRMVEMQADERTNLLKHKRVTSSLLLV